MKRLSTLVSNALKAPIVFEIILRCDWLFSSLLLSSPFSTFHVTSSSFSLNFVYCLQFFSISVSPPSNSHQELPEDIRANLTEELPQPRKIPRKLSEYTQEEIDAFPRLWIPYVEKHTHTHSVSDLLHIRK